MILNMVLLYMPFTFNTDERKTCNIETHKYKKKKRRETYGTETRDKSLSLVSAMTYTCTST